GAAGAPAAAGRPLRGGGCRHVTSIPTMTHAASDETAAPTRSDRGSYPNVTERHRVTSLRRLRRQQNPPRLRRDRRRHVPRLGDQPEIAHVERPHLLEG